MTGEIKPGTIMKIEPKEPDGKPKFNRLVVLGKSDFSSRVEKTTEKEYLEQQQNKDEETKE